MRWMQVRVGREGRLKERAARENHEPEEVTLAMAHEVGEHLARDHESVAGLEVAGLHAARNVERDHDVSRAAVDLADLVGHLGSRERHDERRQGDETKRFGQPLPACAATDRRARKELNSRKTDAFRRRPATAAPQPDRPAAREQAAEEGTQGQRTASATSASFRDACHRSNRP